MNHRRTNSVRHAMEKRLRQREWTPAQTKRERDKSLTNLMEYLMLLSSNGTGRFADNE